ncbi:MAG: 3-phosphoshikimate 1-carboxyvinyltransferase [Burkholderiaceae bacterium]
MASSKKYYEAKGGTALIGGLRVPGDKSISHRTVMLGALADGTTHVSGFLAGADALSTCAVFRQMGVSIDGPTDGRLIVTGVGIDGLKAPAHVLDCGNAGTAMRLLTGVLAAQSFNSELVGDESLSQRPMKRVMDPLSAMGAKIEATDGKPPLRLTGGQSLQAIHYKTPMASAQVKSAVLLAGLFADGKTRVTEPGITRDHTERMLEAFGVTVERDGLDVSLTGGQRLQATDIDVPADISSAAFFMVGASIAPGSDITLSHVGVNPTRTGVIDILRAMGADIELSNQRVAGGEPVADIRVRYAPLSGIDIDSDLVPLAIDEFPAIFVAAACARGTTRLLGAAELRVKESDRIAVMEAGLHALGADASGTPDGMVISGVGEGRAAFGGGEVDSHGDHRTAMAFAMASLRAAGPVTVADTANVGTSFPGFTDACASLGLTVTEQEKPVGSVVHAG